ncbi:MAG: hypothetical protein EP343_12930 [Deltaproteobacteria bacterium]|nr:MAG: hypothetical protein EP343_12930 [Deltaproteobacteria bacterium]
MKPRKQKEESGNNLPAPLTPSPYTAQEASQSLSSTGSLLVYRKEQEEREDVDEEQGRMPRQHTIRAMVIEPSQDGFPASSLSQELLPEYSVDHQELYTSLETPHGNRHASPLSQTPTSWSNAANVAEMPTHPELPNTPYTPSAPSHPSTMSNPSQSQANNWSFVVTELEGEVVQGNEFVTQETLPWMEGMSAIHALLRSHFPEETVHMEMKVEKKRLTSINFDEGVVVMAMAPTSRNRRDFEEVARQIHQSMNSR